MANHDFIVRLRGLPFTAVADDIIEFFGNEVKIPHGKDSIHFLMDRMGRPEGACFVELASDDDVRNALLKHKEHIGTRYVEVFKSTRSEMEYQVARSGCSPGNNEWDCTVKMRGIPYSAEVHDIKKFFEGIPVQPGRIKIAKNWKGASSGEAYVQFTSIEAADKAMLKNKEYLGKRYVELFKANWADAEQKARMDMSRAFWDGGLHGPAFGGPDWFGNGLMGGGDGFGPPPAWFPPGFPAMNGFGAGFAMGPMGFGGMPPGRAGPSMGFRARGGHLGSEGFGRGRNAASARGRTRYTVAMKGLPFDAKKPDVQKFFMPLTPVEIRMHTNEKHRFNGNAEVDFASLHEAQMALSRNRAHMGPRYIELSLLNFH